jgi:beta-galactosidase
MNVLSKQIGLRLLLSLTLLAGCAATQENPRDFNEHWRFTNGEQSADVTDMAFDDTGWEAVRLPHDWAIAGPFNPDEHGYAGKLPWKGVGWYRKVFELDKADQGKRVYLDFDGAMAFPQVYVNGHLAGQWDYGYMSFRVDATEYVQFDQPNIVAVRADTHNQGTRWYPGAGIYRKVTLTLDNPVHFAHWGTFITTPQVSDQRATVAVQTDIENHTSDGTPVQLKIKITDPSGNEVAHTDRRMTIDGQASTPVLHELVVNDPVRWDITDPQLYTLHVSVVSNGKTIDSETIPFGIRTFEFTADDGFHLNGRRVQLYGVNLHHDHGPLGAAFYTRAMERQLEIMQDMGVNCIRTSHNPPAPELLDLCDRMGLLVWNECFDKWDDKAGRVDGEPPLPAYGEKQIRNFVKRDRNHPSVVVWSIGNEINNQPGDPEGKSAERVTYMRDFFLKYDTTRPVGIACHIPWTATQDILDAMDLTGWNYDRRYVNYREKYPDKPIIYSESASTLSTRGFYELPLPATKADYSDRLQVCSYDLNAASWSDIPDKEFALMQQDGFVAGEMVWTGFDYLGEPTPFDQQARSSYFGIVDLCGIPKDRYYLYRSHWRPDVTTVHILPHWNWPDRIGQNVPVFVYTNGDAAELFLNGKSLGRRVKGEKPEKPANFALGKVAAASSVQGEHAAANAVDNNAQTRWTASSETRDQWLAVDLGQVQPIRYIGIEFEREAKNYGYQIQVSNDESKWETIVTQPASSSPQWGGPHQAFYDVDATARYVRLTFTDLRDRAWASVRQLGVYPERVESDYYAVTYDYRLRWNEVIYEPGELKAVAYKDGEKIGEAVMRTAGDCAALRLTPDRNKLNASGDDLAYILVEALDADGTPCPLADDTVHFDVTGPAEIAGVGNGNPLSYEPFQADYRKLFYGKAMLILRTQKGQSGTIRVTATAEGINPAAATLTAH